MPAPTFIAAEVKLHRRQNMRPYVVGLVDDARLNDLREGVVLLHDRRLPGARPNRRSRCARHAHLHRNRRAVAAALPLPCPTSGRDAVGPDQGLHMREVDLPERKGVRAECG